MSEARRLEQLKAAFNKWFTAEFGRIPTRREYRAITKMVRNHLQEAARIAAEKETTYEQ